MPLEEVGRQAVSCHRALVPELDSLLGRQVDPVAPALELRACDDACVVDAAVEPRAVVVKAMERPLIPGWPKHLADRTLGVCPWTTTRPLSYGPSWDSDAPRFQAKRPSSSHKVRNGSST